jgi:hypothetical protein
MINVTPFWNKFLDNIESFIFELLTFFGPIETNGNFGWGEFGKKLKNSICKNCLKKKKVGVPFKETQ